MKGSEKQESKEGVPGLASGTGGQLLAAHSVNHGGLSGSPGFMSWVSP